MSSTDATAGYASVTLPMPQSQATTVLPSGSLAVPAFLPASCVLSSAPSKTAVSARSGRTDTGRSALEQRALWQMQAHGIPLPEREYRFHPTRRWRFDFCWPAQRVALECEGGVYSGGRHTRGKGYEADAEKYNAAQLAGWLVLRVTSAHINDGSMAKWVKEALG